MKLHAWGIEHDSHGYSISEICFLADNDEPDTKPERGGRWIRLPWLDADAPVFVPELREMMDAPEGLRPINRKPHPRPDEQDGENYELGRADERISVGELLVAVEMVLRDVAPLVPLSRLTPSGMEAIRKFQTEAERVLKLVREYRKDTDSITALGRDRGWYPK